MNTKLKSTPFATLALVIALALMLVFTACATPSGDGGQGDADASSTTSAVTTSPATMAQDGNNYVADANAADGTGIDGATTASAVSPAGSGNSTNSAVTQSAISQPGDNQQASKDANKKSDASKGDSKDKKSTDKNDKKNAGDSGKKKNDSTAPSTPDNGKGDNTGGDNSKDQPAPDPKPTPADNKLTVSIAIDCLMLYAADPGIASQVSNKGIILAKKEVKVDAGANVYDVLKVSGISFVGKSYISSIAGLSEGDVGGKSGWVYNVNGKYPEVGVVVCKVKSGDAIQFRYTMNGGTDVKS